MLLLAIDFIIILFINMHFQNDCEYMVNNVNIQYEIPITKIKLIIKSPHYLIKFFTAEKIKPFVF